MWLMSPLHGEYWAELLVCTLFLLRRICYFFILLRDLNSEAIINFQNCSDKLAKFLIVPSQYTVVFVSTIVDYSFGLLVFISSLTVLKTKTKKFRFSFIKYWLKLDEIENPPMYKKSYFFSFFRKSCLKLDSIHNQPTHPEGRRWTDAETGAQARSSSPPRPWRTASRCGERGKCVLI